MHERENKENVGYWFYRCSELALAREVKKCLPWVVRLFVKVYVDRKVLDLKSGVIRVYYSFGEYEAGKRFCYEFTAEDLIKISKGRNCITVV